MNSARRFLLTCLFCAFGLTAASAGSATWAFTPASGDWNTAANWVPATVPNDPADVATFDVTRIAHLTLSASVQVDSLVFNPGATGYTIVLGTSPTSITLTIGGAGIVNNSGIVQNFVVNSLPSNQINFTGSAKAGVMTRVHERRRRESRLGDERTVLRSILGRSRHLYQRRQFIADK